MFGALIAGLVISSIFGIAGLVMQGKNRQDAKDMLDTQFQQQQQLAEQSQGYYEKNSYNQYLRQRELMVDGPSLNKAGMQKAGLSTASLTGQFSSPSPAQGPAISTGTAPSPAPTIQANANFAQTLQNLGQSMQQIPSFVADLKQKNEVNTGLQIDNMYRAAEWEQKLFNMKKEGLISHERWQELLKNNKYLDDTYEARVRQQWAQTIRDEIQPQLMALQGEGLVQQLQQGKIDIQISEEQLKQAQFVTETQGERFWNEMENMKISRAATAEQIKASVLNRAHEQLKMYGTELQNKLTEANVPNAKEIADIELNKKRKELEIFENQLDIVIENAKQEKFDTSVQKQRYVAEQVSTYISSFTSVFNAIKPSVSVSPTPSK